MAILGIHIKFLWEGGYTKKSPPQKICKNHPGISTLSIQFDPLRRVGHGRQHGGAAGLHAFQAAGRFQNFIELMSLEAGKPSCCGLDSSRWTLVGSAGIGSNG